MKKLILLMMALGVVHFANAQNYTSLDSKNKIVFQGDKIVYEGQTIVLGPKTLFLDGQLSDAEADKFPYVFNTFQKAAAQFADGTEQQPMTLYIAPWVYWIDDPDDPAIRRGENGHQPFGMVVRCQHLHLIGLNPDAQNIVLAAQRGQTQGAIGNFQMFDFYGDGLTIKNMTLGNYCNVDLDYPLKPSLSRKMRMPAITQAHVAGCHGDKAFAQNVRFISRLNMTPLSGAKRLLFDHCHMESTDDALASTGVYLHCTLDFYGQKPFWSSDRCGAVFLDCDFSVCHDEERTYFCKAIAPINLVDCRFHCDHFLYAGYTHTPSDWLRSYQYHVTMNEQPYFVGAEKPYNTICMEQRNLLGAYRLSEGEETVYNTYNLLRGEDNWDPMGIRQTVERIGKRDGRDYTNMATALLVTPRENELQTGGNNVTLKAELMRHSGYPLNNQQVHWRVEPGKEKFVKLSAKEGTECVVTPLLDEDNPVHVNVIAYTDDGLEGCAEMNIKPAFVEPPVFTAKPRLTIAKGMARVDYQLNLNGRKDQSLITWYRIKDGRQIPVSGSRLDQPEYTYPLRPEDVGYRLAVKVEPKHLRCLPGKAVEIESKAAVKKSQVTGSDTYETDFQNFPTTVQQELIPGFWTVDSYKPADTNEYGWTVDPAKEYWYYGEGINGCVGTGLYGIDQGARLLYTPLAGNYGSQWLTLHIDPSKTAGQGFSSARQQYLDIYLKYDTRTLTGYGLRIIRTTKYHNAVDFLLIRSEKGIVTPISAPVSSICYITNCTVTLTAEGNRLTAHAETTSPMQKVSDPNLKPTVDLSAEINPNGNGGYGVMYTGNAGEGANMLHRLKVKTECK